MLIRSRNERRKLGARGFSLAEMMIVVAIFGVMTGIAVNNLRDVLTANIENGAARSIAALLKRARQTAQATHSRVRIVESGGSSGARTTITMTSCKSKYGTSICVGETDAATYTSMTSVTSGSLTFGDSSESKGVTFCISSSSTTCTAPTTDLIFNSGGYVETTSDYYVIVKHRERTNRDRWVHITGAGEVKLE